MNEVVNQFFIDSRQVMPELHLQQPGFIYSACRQLTKHRDRVKTQRNKEI